MGWMKVRDLLPECHDQEYSDPVLIIYIHRKMPLDPERISIACYSEKNKCWCLPKLFRNDEFSDEEHVEPLSDDRVYIKWWCPLPHTPDQQRDYDYQLALKAFDEASKEKENG